MSGGKKISVDEYLPKGSDRRPAIIVLHGSGGVLFAGFELEKHVRAFAEQGYAVFYPHFFNRTGHFFVRRSMVHRNLPAWTDTVQDCVSYVAANPRVDSRRIALLGYSLGGYLALGTAARDPRVDAVVEAAGALDESGVKRMPPTLILHGAKDGTVPVAKAEHLKSLLKKIDTPYQEHIYPTEGHQFSPAALRDATQRIDAFLRKHFPAKSHNQEQQPTRS